MLSLSVRHGFRKRKTLLKIFALISAYEKFQRTFFSINLCGLRKSHKVHLCRKSIRASYKWYAQLESEDYDQHLCRKRRIRIDIPDNDQGVTESENFHLTVETEISLLLCPRITTVLDSDDDFMYLSSTLLSRSVLFFTRKNERGEPFVSRFLVGDLNEEKLAQDQRRARFMLYPTEEEREEQLRESRTSYLQQFEEGVNLKEGSVQMPTVIARFGHTLSINRLLLRRFVQVNRRKQVVEDILISYSQIKTTNFGKE